MEGLDIELLLSPVVVTVLLGLTSVVLLAWYSSRNHDYWKKRGVPYAKPFPFLGSMLQNGLTPLHDLELKRYKEHGHIYGHFEGNRPLLSVADPALLRQILVKDFNNFVNRRNFATGDVVLDNMVPSLEGEDWKRVRTVITPTFTTGKIKRMLNIFKECAATAVQNFKEASSSGKPANAKSIFGAFTMDVIASSAFSTKLNSHKDPENQFVQMARRVFGQSVSWRFLLIVLFPSIAKLLKIPIFDPEPTHFFRDVTVQLIKERKQTGKKRHDFLQLLMDTAKEVEDDEVAATEESEDITSNYGEESASLKKFKNISNNRLSMDEIVAQCVIFFLAGYETTATTLSLISYLLALNPDAQEKAREEVQRTLKENNGEMTYEGIQSMKYLDNVISETLRIFPPAVRLERVTEEEYELGDTGIIVTKGMIVTIPAYALHHDPNYFPQPHKFDPDRFAGDEKSSRDQYTYLPFGAGPRNCIGMRFALMEIKVCLTQVLLHFNINKAPQTKVPLEFRINPQIMQPKEVLLEFEPRN